MLAGLLLTPVDFLLPGFMDTFTGVVSSTANTTDIHFGPRIQNIITTSKLKKVSKKMVFVQFYTLALSLWGFNLVFFLTLQMPLTQISNESFSHFVPSIAFPVMNPPPPTRSQRSWHRCLPRINKDIYHK